MQRLISILLALGVVTLSAAASTPAQAASLALSSPTGAVRAGGSAYVMLVLTAPVASCRLVALRPGRGPRELGVIVPTRTHIEWSWRVPIRTRSATWRLDATCGSAHATIHLTVLGSRAGRPRFAQDTQVGQYGSLLAAQVIPPLIRVQAKHWWARSADVILSAFHSGISFGECTDYAVRRRPDVVARVDAWAYANYLLRGRHGPLRVDWNARMWTYDAERAGMTTGSRPRMGAVIVFQPGAYGALAPFGHVAVVNSVAADGSFTISEMHAPAVARVTSRWFGARTARAMASDPGVSFIYR